MKRKAIESALALDPREPFAIRIKGSTEVLTIRAVAGRRVILEDGLSVALQSVLLPLGGGWRSPSELSG